ncbi:hypothetical protein ACJX0J_028216 [Zea mays]
MHELGGLFWRAPAALSIGFARQTQLSFFFFERWQLHRGIGAPKKFCCLVHIFGLDLIVIRGCKKKVMLVLSKNERLGEGETCVIFPPEITDAVGHVQTIPGVVPNQNGDLDPNIRDAIKRDL